VTPNAPITLANAINSPTTPTTIKIVCSKSDHLKVDLPFSWALIEGKIFSLFFRERKIDAIDNTSGFIIFQAIIN